MKIIKKLLLLTLIGFLHVERAPGVVTVPATIVPNVAMQLWCGDRYVAHVWRAFDDSFRPEWLVPDQIESEKNEYYEVFISLKSGALFGSCEFQREQNYGLPYCDEDPHLPNFAEVALEEESFVAQNFLRYNLTRPYTDFGPYGIIYVLIPGPASNIIYSARLGKVESSGADSSHS